METTGAAGTSSSWDGRNGRDHILSRVHEEKTNAVQGTQSITGAPTKAGTSARAGTPTTAETPERMETTSKQL